MKQSRRGFIKSASAVAVGGSAFLGGVRALAKELKLPLGLQLYSLREQLPGNYEGTLKDLGALGYQEVESAGYYEHSAAEVSKALGDAKLKLVSAHFSSDDLHARLDEILAFQHELGVGHIICSYPGKDPARLKKSTSPEASKNFTLDDFRWNAEQFNTFGEKVKAAGMKFGYHNHTVEFRETEGVLPFEELLRLTDPSKVTIEMDCGWVVVGGGDPVALLRKYPNRISLLHVKDFKLVKTQEPGKNEPTPVELGRGSIDYRPIFAEAAKGGNVKHCFVEQEAFTLAPMESLKVDAEYMRKLGAA